MPHFGNFSPLQHVSSCHYTDRLSFITTTTTIVVVIIIIKGRLLVVV
jgi:hypothetical protein